MITLSVAIDDQCRQPMIVEGYFSLCELLLWQIQDTERALISSPSLVQI